MLIKINSRNPQARLITKVVEILKKGGIIAYPTDTYYGIGCDIMNKKAINFFILSLLGQTGHPQFFFLVGYGISFHVHFVKLLCFFI